MTKIEFIGFLESDIDFLDSKDKKSVIDFFSEKFSYCTSEEEENAMIEAFGAPEEFVEKLKSDYNTSPKKGRKKSREMKNYLEGILRSTLSDMEGQSDGNDLIFSKPIAVEKASEVVHSLEDHEVKTLYGKKVVIDNNEKAEKIIEPIDEANGLTTEEIRIAKAETLEKANSFSDSEEAAQSPIDSSEAVENRIPLEEDFTSETPHEEEEVDKRKFYPGIFNKIVSEDKYSGTARIALLVLLTIAVSPIILAAFGAALSVYAALVAFTVAITVLLFGVMLAVIAIGVVELVYGILILFKNIPAALIELGFGTILFAIVIAIAALIYEFIFGIVPKWLKWITALFVRYTKLLYCYLYGGKA